jgi:hypothetical protein
LTDKIIATVGRRPSTLQQNKTVEATDEWWEQQRNLLQQSLPPKS